MRRNLVSAAGLLAALLAAAPPAGAAGDRVVARVAKEPVTQSEVSAWQAERGGLTFPQALEELLDRLLVLAWARDRRLRVPDEEVESMVESVRQRNGLTPAQFEQALAAQGLDLATFRQRVRDQALISDATAAALAGRADVSEEMVARAYAAAYPPRQTLSVSHILLKLARDAAPEEAARREAEASALAERVRAGQPFDALARELSEDPSSAARGGDLGTFLPGELLSELEQAAAALSVGQAGGPVRTAAGLHLIKVTARAEAPPVPLASVREQLVAALRQSAQEEARRGWLAELRRKYFVEVFPD